MSEFLVLNFSVPKDIVIEPDDTTPGQYYERYFNNSDLDNGDLTVIHLFNKRLVTVVVQDNLSREIEPDDIIFVDNDKLVVKLASYQPIIGTWLILVQS